MSNLVEKILGNNVDMIKDNNDNRQIFVGPGVGFYSNEYIKLICLDEIIVVIGSDPAVPPIEGTEYAIQAVDAYEMAEQLGERTVIIGGGTIGCELALLLDSYGKKTTVLEMTDRLHRQNSLFYDIALDQQLAIRSGIETRSVQSNGNRRKYSKSLYLKAFLMVLDFLE